MKIEDVNREVLRALARMLDRRLNGREGERTEPGIGFALAVFPLGGDADGTDAQYIGNYAREAAPIVLRRLADRLEANNLRARAMH